MSRTVRVATYNLYLGADLSLVLGDRDAAALEAGRVEVRRQLARTAFPLRVDAIAAVLAREAADLVGVQELCVWLADGHPLWDYGALLLRALARAGTPYELVAQVETFHGTGDVPSGADPGRPTRLRLSGSNAVLRRADSAVRVTGTRSGLFGAALSTPLLGDLAVTVDRGWCAAEAVHDGRRFVFVTTHTEAHDADSRDHQRDELLAVLPPGPLVVVGDFNAGPDGVGMPDGLGDAWLLADRPGDGPDAATSGQRADLSNELSELSERIDYVWVRGVDVLGSRLFGAEPADRTATGLWPSDHAGVLATVALPD